MSLQFQCFVGYDPRQPIAERIASHSLMTRSSQPVPVTRLQLNQLPISRRGLTEFTYSRFLVPFLSGFDGYSLFLDADMLVLSDILTIREGIDPLAAVSVVQHEGSMKFERASVMLFNNKRCKNLTPAFVDDVRNGMFDLRWASKVGTLDRSWNHLVGYDAPNPNAKIVHFTKGIPCWNQTKDCEFAEAWQSEAKQAGSTVPFEALMGGSVHVQRAS